MKPTSPASDRVRTPVVLIQVAAIHALAFGGFSLLQGCATRAPRTGSHSSTAIAQSRPAAAPAAPAPAPASAGALSMPPRKSDSPAAPAPVGGGVKPFTPPPFTPAAVSSRPAPTPAAVKTPAVAVSGQTYTVQAGDSLSAIAVKHGVKTSELLAANGLADANKIRIGQKLSLPVGAKTPSAAAPKTPEAGTAPAAPAAVPGLVNAPAGGVHVVKSGDSLGKIAKQYGTTIAALKQANKLTSDNIRIDQKLVLPGGSAAPAVAVVDLGAKTPAPKPTPATDVIALLGSDPAAARPAPTPSLEEVLDPDVPVETLTPAPGAFTLQPTQYKLLPGDTIARLAAIFLTSEAEIRRLNKLGPNQELRAGDSILIPPPKDP
jgi:LysM repeat protein